MILIQKPSDFDVMVMGNLFGDIITDEVNFFLTIEILSKLFV